MATSLNKTVEKLLKGHIADFRAAVADLDDNVLANISNLEDFSAPNNVSQDRLVEEADILAAPPKPPCNG